MPQTVRIYRTPLSNSTIDNREYLFRTEERDDDGNPTLSMEYAPDGSSLEKIQYSYDGNRRLVREEMENSATGSNCTIIRTFDDTEKTCVEQEFFGEEEEVNRRICFDENGNPLSIITREDGEIHTEEIFEYSGKLPVKHTVSIKPENCLEETRYSYEKDRMTEELFLEDGEEAGRILFTYSEEGNLLRISHTDREEPPMDQEFSHDEKGNVIRIDSHSEGVLVAVIHQTWDEQGRRLSEEHRDETNEVSHGYKCTYNNSGKVEQEIYFDHHSEENYSLRYEYS